jgi:hypothetical protein
LTLLDEASHGIQGGENVFSSTMPGHPVIATRYDITVDTVALYAAKARGDLAAARAAIRPPVSHELTPDESKKVAQLGQWLWARKCP